VIQFVVMCCDV